MKFAARYLLVLFSHIALSICAQGAIGQPIRHLNEWTSGYLASTYTDTTEVTSARVVLADYALIAKDFPQMKKSGGETDEAWHSRIDHWLIEQTSFIQREQLQNSTVNTSIATGSKTKTTFRPKGYNRAHIMQVSGGGFVDIKGVGTDFPAQKDHKNGLATLGEMVREYAFDKLISLIFDSHNPEISTVGSYAVVDFGFDVIHADGSKSPAGYIVRQAHQRSSEYNSSLPRSSGFKVEEALRTFGLTSSGETFAKRPQYQNEQYFKDSYWAFDYVNVQGTNNRERIEIIDFGAFVAVNKFFYDLRATDLSTLRPHSSSEFKQPSDDQKIPFEIWGSPGQIDPKKDYPFIWSHELAQNWRNGVAQRSDFEQHINNLLNPILAKLQKQKSCSVAFD